MPFKETSAVSQRKELVELLRNNDHPQAPTLSELSRNFGVTRKTAHKWLRRANSGEEGWELEKSRRPRHSPHRTPPEVQEKILAVRRDHPAWGARKIARFLCNSGKGDGLPSISTITAILGRAGLLREEDSARQGPVTRFERGAPNELWQMDFKGHFPLGCEGDARCHPLVIVDDHSRYCLLIEGLFHEREQEVSGALAKLFRKYGLPLAMLMDNGPLWRPAGSGPTRLTAWLMRLHIRILHGRLYHPQTQGKCERFNRTLKAEALPTGIRFADMNACQRALDNFRQSYNHIRPHEALDMNVPASRYHASRIAFPEKLPPIEYLGGDIVRKVNKAGTISIASRFYNAGRAFSGEPVALRPTTADGVYDLFYCHSCIRQVDLRDPDYVKYERKNKSSF